MDYNMGPFKPNPKGLFDSTANYKYFDLVRYDGSAYLNINEDLVDGVSCTGILPTGQEESELYWMCIVERGDIGAAADQYLSFTTITNDGVWDYSETDKIIVPSDMENQLSIENVYDGCCGMILTENKSLILPDNSDYSVDFNYIGIADGQYYMYTFVYGDCGSGLRFMWNRTVMNRG